MSKLWDILRDYKVGIFNKYWWNDVWYEQVSSRIHNRQRWLLNAIPRTWKDKDTIFEICILEGIKHFVEGEGALSHYEEAQADPSYPDHQKKFDTELKEMYQLITIRLPQLEEAMERAWNTVPTREEGDISIGGLGRDNYQKVYGEVDRLENEIADLKTKVMLWAVENRRSMWT